MNGRPSSSSELDDIWVMFLDQGHYRLSPRVQTWKHILAKRSGRSRRRLSNPEKVGAETRAFTATKKITSRAKVTGSYPARQ
jgi:hypothetical protein